MLQYWILGKTFDCKEISVKVLDGREYYSFYPSDLFILCLRIVTYPDQLKCARIPSIFKSGNKTNIDKLLSYISFASYK